MQKSTKFCVILQKKQLSVTRSERAMAETKVWDTHSKAGNRWCRNGEARDSEWAKERGEGSEGNGWDGIDGDGD